MPITDLNDDTSVIKKRKNGYILLNYNRVHTENNLFLRILRSYNFTVVLNVWKLKTNSKKNTKHLLMKPTTKLENNATK